ncbi:hypothetical protein [Nocardioides sp.]|uniref:hypothetical protein n=1 Tax=Nocardioides sp. TaxID=35761 RepID=UPI0035277B8D
MRGRFGRRTTPEVALAPGERVLAWAEGAGGLVAAGSRQAFYLVPSEGDQVRLPWEQVEAADWDRDESTLRVAEVGTWGERRVVHEVVLETPGDLLAMVRERVTASIVLQRHIPVTARRGLRVVGRRSPVGDAPVEWFFEYDAGVDPDDPTVRLAAEAALDQARSDAGL